VPAVRSRALHHAKGSQREHGRAGVISQHARISRRPARVKLRSVEQGSNDRTRADGPYDFSHIIDLGEVFAHEGNERDLVSVFYKVDGATGYLHRFPPADVGVEGAPQVVLEDLSLVQRPWMVFVLADVKPLFAG